MSRQQYTDTLDSIFSFLSQGHNSIRLESHTLPLWSVTVGVLIGFTGLLMDALTPALITNDAQRKLFLQIYIGVVVLLVIVLDRYLINKKRRQRDESVSALHRKINTINWTICGSGVLIMMFAAQSLPGIHELFGFYIILSGFCLYVFGLFAYAWLRWAGVIQIILGVCALFLLTNTAMKIYAASSFIVGGLLIHWLDQDNLNLRQLITRSFAWVMAVLCSAGGAYTVYYKIYLDAGHFPMVALSEYNQSHSDTGLPYVVMLPAGTELPIEYIFEFDLLENSVKAQWTMQLESAVDVVMQNGNPTGVYRIGNGPWRLRKDSLEIARFHQQLFIDTVDGPTIQREIYIRSNRQYPGLKL